MCKLFCKGGAERAALATSLSYALTVLMGLEALHPSCCQWTGMNPEQSFGLSAIIATISMFVGTFIWTRHSGKNSV